MKKSTSLLLFACLLSMNLLQAQKPASLVYEGILTDIEGEVLVSTNLELDIKMTLGNKEVVFESSDKTSTNEKGVFQVSASDLPAFDPAAGKLTIGLTIKSADDKDWMDAEQFSLLYYLTESEDGVLKMTRSEGRELYSESTKPVWFFKDTSPFGYLSSTFMFSFSKDISDPEDIILICNKMKGREELTPQQPASRGAKGGYAVGSYKKKK